MSDSGRLSNTTEVDPTALEERKDRWRDRLTALRPDYSPADWCSAARSQLVFWIGRRGAHRLLPSRFLRIERAPKGLSVRETFAAFFCFEPEEGPDYFEVPFLLAVAEGDREGIESLAQALDLCPSDLPRELFLGPFIPASAWGDTP